MTLSTPELKVCLILTGSEIMSGEVVDSNSAEIAQSLSKIGLTIWKKVTVGDDLPDLVEAFVQVSKESDIVIVNGGLGPTVDDCTAEAAALSTISQLEENQEALNHLKSLAKTSRISLNQSNLKQAQLPQGARTLANPIGTALGFAMKINHAEFYFTPGVPKELYKMIDEVIVPDILEKHPNINERITLVFTCFGLGESQIQEKINKQVPEEYFQDLDLGFRVNFPYVEIKLTYAKTFQEETLKHIIHEIKSIFYGYLIHEGKSYHPEFIQFRLLQEKKTVAVAESCTGGKIAAKITSVSGASKIFHAGFIVYSNSIKHSILDVGEELLEKFGAVSKPVVEAMIEGTLLQSKSDYAIAISGIAGPEGGSPEKPVGTVFIAWGSKDKILTRQLQIKGNRKRFQELASVTALDLFRRELLGMDTDCPYYFDQLSSL
ncbi:MAG: nicotinamide-nucleotide amidase [bacterium]|jgi:nicotinamide-nucleotide amidase